MYMFMYTVCAVITISMYMNIVSLQNQEKHNRLKRLKRLSELEVAMCHCLDESPQLAAVLQSGLVPSEEELQNYRGRVGRLEKKKVNVHLLLAVDYLALMNYFPLSPSSLLACSWTCAYNYMYLSSCRMTVKLSSSIYERR